VNVKRTILRARVDRDVHEAIDHYLGEGAERAALKFIDALEQALQHIGRHPATGSPRYAHELDLPGLRCWQVKGYPHLVFYFERDDHVDVWRVLHGSRDIPAWMQVPD
jgi:toxin ParE1/3/4